MSMSPTVKNFPEAEAFPELKLYWDAAEVGRFVLPECGSCGRVYWYPRAVCPHCSSTEVSWREASGTGRIYSYSVLRRVATPYVLAYIELDEGVRMLSNVIHCDVDSLSIGQRVRIVFEAGSSGLPVPMFEPLD